ncbi:hypothetical protein FHR83_006791 [Actinoplanes campanulatus]|uniref:Uncharacterized protein n=1 Tax=Actinoplanes campanulatus TaxID=113559 RepID=A0A7W5FI41_9ACTN|nr:hypothetical protein [Actinoplanes campanulatus]MBB3099085.1 hypothetical protein [Actinoplanes campanulatus]GGN39108.1 hypothetical protein GCM10010109_66670 [Actinoplanes campanulatus]GID40242.1 hypothetical protein Aca09nite_67480 [Actinoplanes campanulatus]
MTGEPQETYYVEYPCGKYCKVEIDLAEAHGGFTHRQMRAAADVQHAERHELESTPVLARVSAEFRAPA